MRICVIASRLFSGGFTSSMLNMLYALKEDGIEADILFLAPDRHKMNPAVILKGFHVMNAKRVQHGSNILFALHYRLECLSHKRAENKIAQEADADHKKLLTQRNLQKMLLEDVRDNYEKIDLSSYDAVVSWEEFTCNDYLAYKVKARKKIGYIHPDYIHAGFDSRSDLPVLRKLDKIIAVSHATSISLKKVFPAYAGKITYAYNVLNKAKIDELSKEDTVAFDKSSFDIVTVSRLDIHTKGLDLLVDVCEMLQKEEISFEWNLIGDGEGREYLEKEIQSRNLIHLHLLGEKKNPYPFMKKSDLFVLLSRYEGMPVSVQEAMYLSTPPLVTCYDSAAEQIQNHVNGFIVPMNEQQIFQKIKELITHPDLLAKVRKNLQQEDKSRYFDTSTFRKLIAS